MVTLNSYKKYYPVNYDYAKQLPEGWQLLPNIAIFQERIERGYENEELLSVTIGRGVIKQADLDKKDSSTLDKSKYLLVYPGDLVYSMRFRQGASGYSNYKGIVSPACTVLKPRKGVKFNPRYFHYKFRSGFYKNYAERYAYGIADGQMPLRYVDFKRMYSIVPPLSVQNSIVAYLDKKNEQIDTFIRNKERLIKLLQDQISDYIDNLTTNGLPEKNKTLQAIEDIYEIKIPHHWKITRVGFCSKINRGSGYQLLNSEYSDSKKTIKCVRIGDFLSSEPMEVEYKKTLEQYRLRIGDILIAGTGATAGITVLVDEAIVGMIHSYNSLKIRCNNVFPKYLLYALKSYFVLEQQNLQFSGSAQPFLDINSIKKFRFALPDNINEQKEIVNRIEDFSNKINLAIAKAQKEISAIKEYREALITDLVTGKRKVSELGLEGFQDDRISEHKSILKSTNPKNHNSDK